MTRFTLIDPSGRFVPKPFAQPSHRGLQRHAADSELAVPRADQRVDFSGDTCLRTNLLTRRLLDAAAAGQVLEIVSDNLSAVETIPFMLDSHGCEHLMTVHHPDHWRIYARKLAVPTPGNP